MALALGLLGGGAAPARLPALPVPAGQAAAAGPAEAGPGARLEPEQGAAATPSGTRTAAAAAALAASAQPLGTAAELLGRPVVAIEIDAPAGESSAALAALIGIQPGYLLARGDVQDAIERLYALGRFAQVEAFVQGVHDAVLLRFAITALLRADTLTVRGLRDVPREAVLSRLALVQGEEVDAGTPELLRARATRAMAHVGYPSATVAVRARPGSEVGTCSYTLTVRQGPPARIAAVHIEGPKHVADALLRPRIRSRPGGVLNHEALDADREALLEALVEHGFTQAQVAAPKIEQTSAGAQVRFFVRAHERLSLHVVGAHAIGEGSLRAMWPGTMAGRPSDLARLFVQRVRTAYAKAGYPDADVHVRLHAPPRRRRIGAALHTLRVDLHVREGAPIWVAQLRVAGMHALPRDVLRLQTRALLARELGVDAFFQALGDGDWASRGPPQQPRPRHAPEVPPEHRWVPELYSQALGDTAAAYRELGYHDVAIEAPSCHLRPDEGPGPPPRTEPSFADDTPLIGAPVGRLSPGGPLPPRTADVLVQVQEGPQRFVDSIAIVGCYALGAAELLEAVQQATTEADDGPAAALSAPLVPGAPLGLTSVEDGRIAIVRRLRDAGHLYARVFARIDQDAAGRFAAVRYTIEEGPQVRVERLLVRGNHRTREGVIRSRIALRPGDRYDLSRALADQRQVLELGTFQTARVRLVDEEHPGERKDVVAEVEESRRQLIEAAPGLSTAQGVRLALSYSHLNLLGTATTGVFSIRANRQLFFGLYGPFAPTLRERFSAYRGIEQLTRAIEREVRLGLRSPRLRFFPADPLLRLDLVDQRINAVRYGLDATTATLGAEVVPHRRVKAAMEVQGGRLQLECPLGDDCDTSAEVRRQRGGRPIQQGRRHSIKFGPTVTLEGRDDPISPSRGYHLFARVAQAFGTAKPGQADIAFAFMKWEAQATGYIPALGAVLALSARAGSIHIQRSLVPIDERFFLGGRDTLRGFVESALIPQDACVVADPNAPLPAGCAEAISSSPSPPLSLGGNTYALLKTELRLPLRENFSLDVFADVGNLWIQSPLRGRRLLDVRVGTGAGLRYATPVGALTVDFGINPAPRAVNAEPSWQLHFSIGSF